MSLIEHVQAEATRERLRFTSCTWVPPRWRTIIDETCAEFGLTEPQLLGESRSRSVSWPRFKAMHRMQQAGMSLPQIGQRLGDKDHTTVLHGTRRYLQPDVQDYLAQRAGVCSPR